MTYSDNQFLPIIGAICGDILGSNYELRGCGTKRLDHELCRPVDEFTDDTVCTVAVAEALHNELDMAESLKHWCRRYIGVGYSRTFREWVLSDSAEPYGSTGNGSAMRVSAAGTLALTLEEALEMAERSATVTHNHPESIKGAQAVAAAIWLALHDASKDEIRTHVEANFGYDLDRNYDTVRAEHTFDSTSKGTVPESIICFLQSDGYEDAVRHAIALGGDADTMAAIAGSIASAYYKEIPDFIIEHCMNVLPQDIKDTFIFSDSGDD